MEVDKRLEETSQPGSTRSGEPVGNLQVCADRGEDLRWRYYSFAGKTVASRTANGSAGVRTLISDHHATAEISINNSTNQLTRRYHDPYGNPRGAAASTWVGDRGFLNKPTDSTGLTQVGARYYDAQTGRFISVDPLMDLTDPQQWNGYAYSNNNPTTYSDPTGLIYCGRVDYRDCNQAYEYNSRTGIGTVHKPRMGISNTFIVNPSQYREHRRQELKLQPAKNRLFKQYRRTALDAAGMIPGPIGMAADGMGMVGSARERDWARFSGAPRASSRSVVISIEGSRSGPQFHA